MNLKKGSIQAERDYYNSQISLLETQKTNGTLSKFINADEIIDRSKNYLKLLDEFETQGKNYIKLSNQIKAINKQLSKIDDEIITLRQKLMKAKGINVNTEIFNPRSKSAKILDKLQDFADANQSKFNSTLRDIAQKINKSTAEARTAVSDALSDIIDECDIGIRIRVSNLEKVLDDVDGGFKNLFQTGHGGGCTDFEMRGYGEKDVFGFSRAIPTDLEAADRPIYGMMIPNLKNDKTREAIYYINEGAGSWYGDGVTVVVKKNKVFNNCSFTIGDSLDNDHLLYGSTFDNPQFNGSFDYFEDKVKKLLDKSKSTNRRLITTFNEGSEYLEVQIHGAENHGVDIIEKVYFDESAFNRAKTSGLIDKLNAKKIPYEELKN